MKNFNFIHSIKKLCLFLLLSFSAGLFSATVHAQSLVIDTTAPRVTSIPSNGANLSSTTYNYVRVPELIALDSLKPDGTFYKSILLAWATFIDSATLPPGIEPKTKTAWSADEGDSWTVSANVARFGSSMKTKSGKIVALEFRPDYVDQHNFPLIYYTSVNNGASWVKHTDGMVQFTQTVLGLRMHKGMIEEPDGSLYTCAYIRYSFSTTFRTYVLKSIDGGKTWKPMLNVSGNPIEIDSTSPTDEGSLTRCGNGSWLMVMKQVSSDPDITLPLLYSLSTNQGASWSAPAMLPGAGSAASGKSPHVILMPNGVLALSYGTPDVELTFSANNGVSWTTPVQTFPDPGGTKRPSGNTAVVSIGPNKLIQFGDNYAKTINPNTQAIWQKEIEIVRPEQNRIDLKAKYSQGAITIMSPQTTLTASIPGHPEARTTGAFDGSTDYWSAAIGTNSGVYQLDLEKTYRLQTIGIGMLYNKTQSATVELSPDNITWTPLINYTNTAHFCVNYTNITPFNARYVRVTVTGSGQIGLGELELYEASSTFEGNASAASSNPHGILPAGYTANGTSASQYGFSVQEGTGYVSNRALKLWDGSSDWRAGIKKVVTASNKKTLEFRCRIAAMPSGGSFNIPMLGTVSGTENTVFWVAVFATTATTGTVKYYNGSSWQPIGSATLPINSSSWKLIRIAADEPANTATLYIDNTPMGTFAMSASPAGASNLTGFGLNSNGTLTSGEVVYFDDVNFYDPDVAGPSGISSVSPDKDLVISKLPAELPEKFSIKLSPNPAKDFVDIQVNHTVKGTIKLNVLNAIGRLVKSISAVCDGSSFTYHLPTAGFAPGLYVISAQQDSHIVKSKAIIVP
jgi:hypothetical protein